MQLGKLTYTQAKGRLYRKESWCWADGTRPRGAAYMKEDGKVYFSSDHRVEYNYDRYSLYTDWYEVNNNGYRVTDNNPIRIGGE